jgi:NAD(P)-dependent dehydrogenase (short-subunit alcohol dehydrogenase family)
MAEPARTSAQRTRLPLAVEGLVDKKTAGKQEGNALTMKGSLVITGGSRGIGAATAILAASRGYKVCLGYLRNEVAAAGVVAEISRAGGQAIAVAADVGDEAQVAAMFDRAETELGPLCGLVNNAGILESQAVFSAIDVARFYRLLRTNLIGPFICAKEALRRMSTARGGAGGAIVNVSSVAARTGAPFEYVDYAASKGALDSLTAGLAREAAPVGVRVNLVRPGFIYTEMHAAGGEPDRVDRLANTIPMARGGKPDEVARAIVWLLSDSASYAVGTTIGVTGGI